jgi:hypothetical protein
MLVIKCEEYMEKVRQFAKDNGIEDKLDKKLKYLDNYGQGEYLVELYQDRAPQSFGFSMFRLTETKEKGTFFMAGGLIFWEERKEWGTHT